MRDDDMMALYERMSLSNEAFTDAAGWRLNFRRLKRAVAGVGLLIGTGVLYVSVVTGLWMLASSLVLGVFVAAGCALIIGTGMEPES